MSGVKKFCITFAGAPGSSKTPIAYFLSTKLNLPIFNNDSIRTEVKEDMGVFNEDEYRRRRERRIKNVIKDGHSFILDGSIDRDWSKLSELLKKSNYSCFIISLDLSKDFLTRLYMVKGYEDPLRRIDQVILDHELFLKKFTNDVGLFIFDSDFQKRLNVSYKTILRWLKTL